jgi:hypothetical protein
MVFRLKRIDVLRLDAGTPFVQAVIYLVHTVNDLGALPRN